MLDFIMKLLSYENIDRIKIPESYKIPRADKMKCKASFYATTGEFQDKIIVNKENILLDGYITYKICKWINKKYVKVLRINDTPETYKVTYRGYRIKSKERDGIYGRIKNQGRNRL